MRAASSLVTVGLCAQVAFGKLQIQLAGVKPVKQENGLRDGFTNALQEAIAVDNVHLTGIAGPSDDRYSQSSSVYEHPAHRELGFVESFFRVFGFVVNFAADAVATVTINIEISGPGETLFELETTIEIDFDGTGIAETDVDDAFLNDDKTGVCDGCTVNAIAGECVSGACAGYDKDASNSNIGASVHGDPHMVGLLGQKINWSGKDNEWYCLLSDGPDFHVNVRLTAPMPKKFPDRQLISAVSILTDNGLHSLVVEAKNPYSTNIHSCPKESSTPCLADGGLRVLVDGQSRAGLQSPVDGIHFVGGEGPSNIVFSATNLPAECRPFGGDRIWATQFAEKMTGRRSLRMKSVPFDQWILQPETLAAPTWCAKFLEEEDMAGLLSTRSDHATLRVETPVADVRINVGVNYQDLETAYDGTVLAPELEFWQTDLGFDGLRLSDNVAGLMGDTSRFVFDDEGVPVTSGLGALHGTVESYRVDGPFARDFEKLRG